MNEPGRRLSPVIRLAPAKLNLTLAVVGRRPDGYHAIHSVMVPLDLSDRLSLAIAAGGEDSLRVDGFDPGPAEANLVVRAIAATRGALLAARIPTPPLAARLEKRIPVAAGLGGGSSDAAAALEGSLEAWGAADVLDAERRSAVAAGLGSDVPFFLAAGPALVEGRGERVTRLRGVAGSPPGVLLVTPPFAVATAHVFAAFAAGGTAAAPAPGATRITSVHLAGELLAGLPAAALVARAGVLASANDLAAAAAVVAGGLVPFRRALLRLLGRPIGLSGSGPTLWALYPSVADAAAAATIVNEAIDDGNLPGGDGRRPFVAATSIASGSADGGTDGAGEGRST